MTKGRLVDAKRAAADENRVVKVGVRPASAEAVTVTLLGTDDCGAAGVICATDRRPPSNSVSATVAGPGASDTAATGAPTIAGEARRWARR